MPGQESAERPASKFRNLRGAVLWSAGMLVALGLVWFSAAVVVPFWQAKAALNAYATDPAMACWDVGWRLGGPESAVRKLSVYLRMPRSMAPHRAEAVGILGECGENADSALTSLLSDGAVQTEAAAALERIRYESTRARVIPATLSAGLMYWAPPRTLLHYDWTVVAGGTVAATCGPEPRDFRKLTGCLVKTERVFRIDAREPATQRWTRDKQYVDCHGAQGLKAGDKVIFFLNEYDGTLAICPVDGSNCNIGIKVSGWDDPAVAAVEALCKSKDWKRALQDKKVQAIWRRFDDIGVDAILQGRYWQEVQEEREAKGRKSQRTTGRK